MAVDDDSSTFDPEALVEPEWLEWYRKTPLERFEASEELWKIYLELGGSLEPDPDPESPFWSREELEQFAKDAIESKRRAFRNDD